MTQSADSSPRLLVVGLNHRTAPLAVREAVAFSPSNLPEALAAFRQRFPHSEIVILSTCNRVELYLSRPVAGEPGHERSAEPFQWADVIAGDIDAIRRYAPDELKHKTVVVDYAHAEDLEVL